MAGINSGRRGFCVAPVLIGKVIITQAAVRINEKLIYNRFFTENSDLAG
jgi:hypothetical protein